MILKYLEMILSLWKHKWPLYFHWCNRTCLGMTPPRIRSRTQRTPRIKFLKFSFFKFSFFLLSLKPHEFRGFMNFSLMRCFCDFSDNSNFAFIFSFTHYRISKSASTFNQGPASALRNRPRGPKLRKWRQIEHRIVRAGILHRVFVCLIIFWEEFWVFWEELFDKNDSDATNYETH